jgi:hypothetical protein
VVQALNRHNAYAQQVAAGVAAGQAAAEPPQLAPLAEPEVKTAPADG